jgi:hypothetical protein
MGIRGGYVLRLTLRLFNASLEGTKQRAVGPKNRLEICGEEKTSALSKNRTPIYSQWLVTRVTELSGERFSNCTEMRYRYEGQLQPASLFMYI